MSARMEEIFLSWSLTLSLILSFATFTLSLLTQEQARTLEAREGRDWWKDWGCWRRGRREAPAAAHGHPSLLNPFMVSSRSSTQFNHPMSSWIVLWTIFLICGKRKFIWSQAHSWIGSKSREGLDLQSLWYGSSQISELRLLSSCHGSTSSSCISMFDPSL